MDILKEAERIFETGRCPSCGSEQTRIERTRKPLRRHKCMDCGATWRSIAINLFDPEALIKAGQLQKEKNEYDYAVPFL